MSDRRVVPIRPRQLQPLNPFFPSTIDGPPPAPLWVVDSLLLPGTLCLLTGAPGIGKSLLLQQLFTAVALGQPWLGRNTEQARCYAVFCEDANDRLISRQLAICEHYDIHQSVLDQEFAWETREDSDATLWEVDERTGIGHPTDYWDQLWQMVRDESIRLLGIDTAATTFTGNENFRSHVTPYMRALVREGVRNKCTVVLNSHPSRGSPNSYSGNSAWLASCRFAFSLGRPKEFDEETGEPALDRVMRGLKSNYSAGIKAQRLRWDQGVFVLDDAEGRSGGGRSRIKRPTNRAEWADLEYRLLDGIKRVISNGGKIPADELDAKSMPSRARRAPDEAINRVPLNDLYVAQRNMLQAGLLIKVEVGKRCMLRTPDGPAYLDEKPWEVGFV